MKQVISVYLELSNYQPNTSSILGIGLYESRIGDAVEWWLRGDIVTSCDYVINHLSSFGNVAEHGKPMLDVQRELCEWLIRNEVNTRLIIGEPWVVALLNRTFDAFEINGYAISVCMLYTTLGGIPTLEQCCDLAGMPFDLAWGPSDLARVQYELFKRRRLD